MIKLNVNNKRVIEVSQEVTDGNINVDIIDSKGEVENFYTITAADMTMLLNYYQNRKDQGLEIF
ncbi:hypothetical protein ACR77J_07870 [Tissierella praeacuta]|uniref:hypothetical protein n=1 Tax=Tissierella praeacuta TaxID=43131 RepID=UPI003DA2F4FC